MTFQSPVPSAPPRGGYNPDHYVELDAVEDRHFWFRARRRIIGALARQLAAGFSPGYYAIEIGCGNGSLLPTLQQACGGGTVIGMDLFLEGLRRARRRTSCPLVQASVNEPPFGVEFAMVGLFDVLEHITDDGAALRAIHGMLTRDGALLMTVPAHQSLFSYFDELSNHCRRYEPAELRRKLIDAGFEVEFLSQCMSALFPMMWAARGFVALSRRLRRKEARPPAEMLSEELRVIAGVNGMMTWLLGSEAVLLSRRIGLPIGTSLVAIARKRGN